MCTWPSSAIRGHRSLLSLSLSPMLVYRSRISPSVARDTRLVVRAYDVTRTDRRYLAAWTFSNGQIHATSSVSSEGTRNCPTAPVITCWRSLQVPALRDARRQKKNDIAIAMRTDHVQFQRNIDFIPERARYILINNISALKRFFWGDSHTERRPFYSRYANSILSSLFRLCEIFQSKITFVAWVVSIHSATLIERILNCSFYDFT